MKSALVLKSAMVLASLIIFTPLWLPYGAFVTKSAGDPNWDPYAGQPGSTYDAAAMPAQTVGTVTYDPYAPLPAANPAMPGATATTPAR